MGHVSHRIRCLDHVLTPLPPPQDPSTQGHVLSPKLPQGLVLTSQVSQ